jgi:hypothetical protein
LERIAFLENKYTRWYYIIINNAKNRNFDGYVEKHHIIPRSLNGTDDNNNIVRLTAREHFVCHLLLTKMVAGQHQQLMKFAVGKFVQSAPWQQRIFTSWEYKKIRETISHARTGKKHSIESRIKMSARAQGRTPWNKGVTGIVHSEESNKKRSYTLTGRKRSDEFCQKVSEGKKGHKAGMTGKKHSEDFIKKINKAWKEKQENGYSSPLTGIPKPPRSKEHLTNLTNANIINGEKRRGIKQDRLTCPHCLLEGGASNLKRYHFNNCKIKTNN